MKKLTASFMITAAVLLTACQQQTAPEVQNQPSVSNTLTSVTSQTSLPPGQVLTPTQAITSSTQASTLPTQGNIYENDYMKITVPKDWTVTKVKSVPGAMNITKGKYILYINPYTVQASGTPGGRFAEISQGAPSADAVILVPPSPPCGTSENTPSFTGHPMVNLYVKKTDKSEFCGAPIGNSSAWYFSYITDVNGDYFNYYQDGIHAFVVTMAYNSKNINSFPLKGSAPLNEMLTEMNNIVKTMVLKQQ